MTLRKKKSPKKSNKKGSSSKSATNSNASSPSRGSDSSSRPMTPDLGQKSPSSLSRSASPGQLVDGMHPVTASFVEWARSASEDAQAFLDWSRGHKLVKVTSSPVPADILNPDVFAEPTLHDIRVDPKGLPKQKGRGFARMTDDEVYKVDEEVRRRVARGNTVFTFVLKSTGEKLACTPIWALKKFTGGIGDEDDDEKEDVTMAEAKESDSNLTSWVGGASWRRFFTGPPESASRVFVMEKANGAAGHLAVLRVGPKTTPSQSKKSSKKSEDAADEEYVWIAGSKNVHLMARSIKDLESHYKDQRYFMARNVFSAIWDLMHPNDATANAAADGKGLSPLTTTVASAKVDQDRFLHLLWSQHFTACFELLDPSDQHVENLSFLGPAGSVALQLYALVSFDRAVKDENYFCEPPKIAFGLARMAGIPTVDMKEVPLQVVVKGDAAKDLGEDEILKRLIADIRLSHGKEGAVLYFVDGKGWVLGLLKKKSIWYVAIRAIREKFKNYQRLSPQASPPKGGKPAPTVAEIQSRTATKLKSRFTEIGSWLGLDATALESWKSLALAANDWMAEKVKAMLAAGSSASSETNVFGLMDGKFPVLWSLFLSESGRTDEIPVDLFHEDEDWEMVEEPTTPAESLSVGDSDEAVLVDRVQKTATAATKKEKTASSPSKSGYVPTGQDYIDADERNHYFETTETPPPSSKPSNKKAEKKSTQAHESPKAMKPATPASSSAAPAGPAAQGELIIAMEERNFYFGDHYDQPRQSPTAGSDKGSADTSAKQTSVKKYEPKKATPPTKKTESKPAAQQQQPKQQREPAAQDYLDVDERNHYFGEHYEQSKTTQSKPASTEKAAPKADKSKEQKPTATKPNNVSPKAKQEQQPKKQREASPQDYLDVDERNHYFGEHFAPTATPSVKATSTAASTSEKTAQKPKEAVKEQKKSTGKSEAQAKPATREPSAQDYLDLDERNHYFGEHYAPSTPAPAKSTTSSDAGQKKKGEDKKQKKEEKPAESKVTSAPVATQKSKAPEPTPEAYLEADERNHYFGEHYEQAPPAPTQTKSTPTSEATQKKKGDDKKQKKEQKSAAASKAPSAPASASPKSNAREPTPEDYLEADERNHYFGDHYPAARESTKEEGAAATTSPKAGNEKGKKGSSAPQKEGGDKSKQDNKKKAGSAAAKADGAADGQGSSGVVGVTKEEKEALMKVAEHFLALQERALYLYS
ncbi:hypothetical protein HK102_009144 [Quaeritorhiza haematococci]|nr:hypothetical protein HK102_009144 [Quaeritorhiza haematococci]